MLIREQEACDSGSSVSNVHVVKCVVVGDTGVGKTRLICKRACGTDYSLKSLMSTHVPTVWAIDHYRNDKEVLKRSWSSVDGITVSLQLWDTFGYHDKDRRFAYGRTDVIIVCYSAVRPRSLHSVVTHWFPEIQRHCPQTPIFLCATQTDLRYLYNTRLFIDLDKGPFFRDILDSDIVPPDRGREVAKEIGAWYYETSALNGHGITGLFTNVMRGALMYKRDKHFWNMLGGLKRIHPPHCETPHEPPMPDSPVIQTSEMLIELDMSRLWHDSLQYDVVFDVGGVHLRAHKAVLIVASPKWQRLFNLNCEASQGPNADVMSASGVRLTRLESSGSSHPIPTHQYCERSLKDGAVVVADSPRHFCDDTTVLIANEQMDMLSQSVPSRLTLSDEVSSVGTPVHGIASCEAFTSIHTEHCTDELDEDQERKIDILSVRSDVGVVVFSEMLRFCYTGTCPAADMEEEVLAELGSFADLMGLDDLALLVTNVLDKKLFLNEVIEERLRRERCARRVDLLLHKKLASDVVFELDDGCVSSHKALLMAACDVMVPMFSYNFTESLSCVVSFPGVNASTFEALLFYLYTGDYHPSSVDGFDLLMLANRLCLPRLLQLTQLHLVDELRAADKSGKDIAEDVLMLIEPAQLHNADNLASWCLWYTTVNYVSIYQHHSKLLMSLTPDNQVYLSKHRWPPVWYLKEVDFYEKYLIDQERKKIRSFSQHVSFEEPDPGCLGFCARRNRRVKPPSIHTSPVSA